MGKHLTCEVKDGKKCDGLHRHDCCLFISGKAAANDCLPGLVGKCDRGFMSPTLEERIARESDSRCEDGKQQMIGDESR